MEFKIEEIGIGSLDQVAKIFLDCLKVQYVGILPNQIIQNFDYEDSYLLWEKSFKNSKSGHFFGGFFEGNLVGFVKFGIDPEDSSAGYVASLYVSPDYSGHGYGTQLMSFAIKSLSAFPKIRLWVFESNPRAIDIYTRLGYLKTGKSRVEDQWQINQIQMELTNS